MRDTVLRDSSGVAEDVGKSGVISGAIVVILFVIVLLDRITIVSVAEKAVSVLRDDCRFIDDMTIITTNVPIQTIASNFKLKLRTDEMWEEVILISVAFES